MTSRLPARERFLDQLHAAVRDLTSAEEITSTVAKLLARHLRVQRCVFAEVDASGTIQVVAEYCEDVPSLTAHHALHALGAEFARRCAQGQPFVVGDSEIDPQTSDARDIYRSAAIRALAVVPLIKSGRCAGGVSVHHGTTRGWAPEEVDLVRVVATHCWESLERARVSRELARKTRSLGLLARAGTRLLSHEHPEELVATLFDEAAELIGVELCFHYAVADEAQRLRLVGCRGLDEPTCATLSSLHVTQALCGVRASPGRPVVRNDVQSRTDAATEWIRRLGVQAYVCFPLVADGVLMGTLSVATGTRPTLHPDDLEFFQAFSEQVAAAYSRARAVDAVRESEARLHQAVALAGLGTFEIDLASDAVIVNEPGRAIYGWAPGEALTFARVQTHFDPEDSPRVLRALEGATRTDGPGTFELEQRILTTAGQVRWIAVRGQVIFDTRGGRRLAVRCVGTYHDISERKDAEARRERTLEAERAARQDAERAARMKDEFLATLSHELRTPLSAILGWAELLERGMLDQGQSARAVTAVRRNAEAQAQLVDDLLDMHRIVSGQLRLDLQALDLSAVVRSAVESLQPSARVKGVQMEAVERATGLGVLADPSRLQQVLWNLVSNAIKFTPEGGRVEVHVTRADHQAEVVVADSGVGIDPDFLPHVFEPFRQQDASSTRHHAGLGLGLSIVKQLVDLHGGTVHVSSPGEGHGAKVSLRLPLATTMTTSH